MIPMSINRHLMFLIFLFSAVFLSGTDIPAAADISGSAHQITLKVGNVTFKELLVFEESLQQRIPMLQGLERRAFDAKGKRSEMQLMLTSDLQRFATELALTEFVGFEVEVLNQTAESLEVRVTPKAGDRDVGHFNSAFVVSKPRVMILISERHWQAPNPATETEMIRKFTENGFKVVDPNQIRKAHPSEPGGGLLHGDPAAAAAIGRQHSAELVIVGEAFSNDTRFSYGLYTSRSTAEVRMLDVDTATIFVAKSQTGNGSDLTENMASQKAFQNTGELLADYLMEYIEHQWHQRGPKTYEISLVVSELTFSQLAQLEQMLRRRSGVDAVSLRSFEAGAAVIGLESQYSAQRLAVELVSEPLQTFSLAVRNFTTRQIDIEVKRAVAVYDVQLVVSDVGFRQLVDLQRVLEKWRGIDTVYLRSFDSGVAVIELRYQDGAQRLAAELVSNPINDFSLDVKDFTNTRIDVFVRSHSALYRLQLVVSDLTFDQLDILTAALGKWEGIEAVSLQSYEAGVAIIDIHSQQDAQSVASAFARKSLNAFALAIRNFTPDRINIDVKRGAAVSDMQFVISKLAFDRLVALKQVLQASKGIANVYLRSFDSGVAVIELQAAFDTQQLVEVLVGTPFRTFSLEITHYTPDRIDIQSKPEE